jgi:hypothetical protein
VYNQLRLSHCGREESLKVSREHIDYQRLLLILSHSSQLYFGEDVPSAQTLATIAGLKGQKMFEMISLKPNWKKTQGGRHKEEEKYYSLQPQS